MKIFAVFLITLLAWTVSANAQSAPELIWNPKLSYSKKTSDRTALIEKFSVFQSFDDFSEKISLQYTELQLSTYYTLNTRWRVGGGYNYSWSEPLIDGFIHEHRLLQQAGYINFLGDQRLAHHFRLEQRIRT